MTKESKEQDVKYKDQEIADLKKCTSELASNKVSANSEMSAVMRNLAKLFDRGVPKRR